MPVITGMTMVMTPFGPMYTPLFTWMTTPLFSWVTMPIFNWYSMPVLLGPPVLLPPMPPPQGPAVLVLDEDGNVMPQKGGILGEECE